MAPLSVQAQCFEQRDAYIVETAIATCLVQSLGRSSDGCQLAVIAREKHVSCSRTHRPIPKLGGDVEHSERDGQDNGWVGCVRNDIGLVESPCFCQGLLAAP